MAIEQTPLESDLRDPRRRHRELNSLLWLCGWGGLTAVALTILAITTQTETANERLRRIFAINEFVCDRTDAAARVATGVRNAAFGRADTRADR